MSPEQTPQTPSEHEQPKPTEQPSGMIEMPREWTKDFPGATEPTIVSDGEYHGGDLAQIARRSGASLEDVQAAAIASIERQQAPTSPEAPSEATPAQELGGEAVEAAQRLIDNDPGSSEQ